MPTEKEKLTAHINLKPMDIVGVADWGRMYDTCIPWFKEHEGEIPVDWIIRYAYGDASNYEQRKCTDNNTYVVLYVNEDKALISLYAANTKVYLIHVNALYHVRKMTLEDIEKELGYKIKLIES